MVTVTGSVDRIVFRNDDTGFCVARFQLVEPDARYGGVTTIVGTMPSVRPGEMLSVTGEWESHPLHGRNLKVDRFEAELPTTVAGIERYLGSGVISGIGPITASRIVEHFGEQTLQIFDSSPDKLRTIAGITPKRLKVVLASWNEQKQIRTLSMFLQEHEISVGLAARIYAVYGDESVATIQSDPYRLAHDIQGIGFRTADSVAARIGISRRSNSRYVAGLRYTLSEAADDGHVYLPRIELLERASQLLQAEVAELEPALLDLVVRGDAVTEDDRVYLGAFHRAETGIVKFLELLRTTPSPLALDRKFNARAVVESAGEQQGLALAPRQVEAAEQALRSKVSILTGGPGTGKTSTLRTVITALDGAGLTFCLCAPTGRAAKRVAETTGRTASTIHRLLEYQPATNSFNYDQSRPLDFDFVIVDEVSMLDVVLAYHLLKAIPPEAHLMLVGDADQLPSVGPGNVLRDLLASEAIPAVRLTDLFRQARGSQIVVAAHEINEGRTPVMTNDATGDLFFAPAPSEEEALEIIKGLVAHRIPTRYALDPLDDVQVLSPMHAGPVGVTSLNQHLQAVLNPARGPRGELQRATRLFRVGDKVMQSRNNYDKDVYNGDIGRVTEIDLDDQQLMVTFPSPGGGYDVPYTVSELDELVLAYAISVHKAQGSEFPCIVMPIVPRHAMMLQRNLVYTAITRARQLCVLVGSRDVLDRASHTGHRKGRNTHLAQRLSTPQFTASLPGLE